MSNALTRAPRRFAVAMACNPATPAPMTSTLAGKMVPAAVIIKGKILFNLLAANNTALYPAAELMALSASIR